MRNKESKSMTKMIRAHSAAIHFILFRSVSFVFVSDLEINRCFHRCHIWSHCTVVCQYDRWLLIILQRNLVIKTGNFSNLSLIMLLAPSSLQKKGLQSLISCLYFPQHRIIFDCVDSFLKVRTRFLMHGLILKGTDLFWRCGPVFEDVDSFFNAHTHFL